MKIQHNLYTITAIFFVVGLLLMAGLVWFSLQDIQRASEQILADRGTDFSINIQNKALDKFKTNYSQYQTDFQHIDQLFIDPSNPIDFIKFLEETSTGSGVKADIAIANLTGKGASDGAPSLIFQVAAQGNFADLVKFSEKLESGPYLASVVSLSMRKPDEKTAGAKSTQNQLQADFLIKVLTKTP